MICPFLINMSLLVGAILSWGVMWPLIAAKKGSWYPAELSPSSLHGLQGYKVAHLFILQLSNNIDLALQINKD
jgi:hypothetical protein